jgi:hypothetical protein
MKGKYSVTGNYSPGPVFNNTARKVLGCSGGVDKFGLDGLTELACSTIFLSISLSEFNYGHYNNNNKTRGKQYADQNHPIQTAFNYCVDRNKTRHFTNTI